MTTRHSESGSFSLLRAQQDRAPGAADGDDPLHCPRRGAPIRPTVMFGAAHHAGTWVPDAHVAYGSSSSASTWPRRCLPRAARLILGVPLYAVTLWFIWLLVAPNRISRSGSRRAVAPPSVVKMRAQLLQAEFSLPCREEDQGSFAALRKRSSGQDDGAVVAQDRCQHRVGRQLDR